MVFSAIDATIKPVSSDQPVITINGMFPGPPINGTTNDIVHVNVFNEMDEPLLFTWNGIQQRLNSWQDGVSGTNCPILPGMNWTYVFVLKDQIGTFFYFPSLNFQKAGGGFGAIRVNNRAVIEVPFVRPEAEFDLLIGDWYHMSYKIVRSLIKTKDDLPQTGIPIWMLMNGKGPYKNPKSKTYESFTVTKGKTYLFRISNVGSTWSFNFRIQNHMMMLVETEGSYTNQIILDSLDVHVGQSYSVLVTADQEVKDYYIVASPSMYETPESSSFVGVGVLHYDTSTVTPSGPLPVGPNPFDLAFSLNQARSIRWNITTGAARPNPQGSFNVSNVTLSQTFYLRGSKAIISGAPHYIVNKVSYLTPDTPLKLADQFSDGAGVYVLDQYQTNTSNADYVIGTFVATGIHKVWIELVFKNDLLVMDSWHLDGFGFFVVGFGDGEWTPASRLTYNIHDPVVRATVQVFPGKWSAVYAFLDNPGMWNLRSATLKNWYLGQELYIRIFDPDKNPIKETPPPDNLILCGKYKVVPPAPAPSLP
ncbi:monocopper oxidase-like protein SKU5 isoform X2 [Tripterygium wilfordii]|uniref:monocopper oxidase-like protein SKU5 isoform X2 n=1 Tax=Tripterygium wilfordii TaxID=458696 RepID=UPI0018F7FCE5|nr:monocopper oxidase-like protein SKU5 isoform X2 [Tripterygium wilfordii]